MAMGISTRVSRQRQAAFTLLDLIIILFVLALLAGSILPRLVGGGPPRVKCVNQLRNIGLAFRTFASDNNGQFPMALATENGGSSNCLGTPNILPHFKSLSNELSTVDSLRCPLYTKSDYRRLNWATVAEKNLDYFVGVNALADNPAHIVSGDRFLKSDAPYSNYLVHLNTNSSLQWLPKPHTNSGNVVFSDGHVESITSSEWTNRIKASGLQVMRLAVPQYAPVK